MMSLTGRRCRLTFLLVTTVALVAVACSSDGGSRLVEPSSTSTSPAAPPTTAEPTIEPAPTGPTTPHATAPSTNVATGPTSAATTVPTTVTTVVVDMVPHGFRAVRATVTTTDGEVCELCVWLAETAGQRSRGLMGVTSLGEADAMAFRYDTPITAAFWMKDTLLPLSIAFFDVDGVYLDAFDMEPCESEPCETYPTPPDFVVAVEFVQGELDVYGVGPGGVFELTDLPCT